METVTQAPGRARKTAVLPSRRLVVMVAAAFIASSAAAFTIGRAVPLQASEPGTLAVPAGEEDEQLEDDDPGVWFALQLDAVWEQLRSSGRVDPSSFAAPLMVASDQAQTVVVAALLDEVCYFGAVIEAGAPDVRVDPSGSACSVELFAELEEALASPPPPVVRSLERAATEAYRFASLGLSPSAPLAGFSASGAVTTSVAPDGASALLSLGGWCVEVVASDPRAEASPLRCP